MCQLTFDDYLKLKNRSYARTCRHHQCDYCYITKKPIDEVQCPCASYEERKYCEGCKHERSFNKPIPPICFSCYRFWFNPDVMTKNMEDHYEVLG